MKKINLEFIVGLFVIAGIVSFGWLSIKLGDIDFIKKDNYDLTARFTSISGLKEGAVVEIAGVRIGKVSKIKLDYEDYEAVVHLAINGKVLIQEDSVASIRSAGLIGDKFVNITPGGSDETITPGDEIVETESTISLEELVSKYIFEK